MTNEDLKLKIRNEIDWWILKDAPEYESSLRGKQREKLIDRLVNLFNSYLKKEKKEVK